MIWQILFGYWVSLGSPRCGWRTGFPANNLHQEMFLDFQNSDLEFQDRILSITSCFSNNPSGLGKIIISICSVHFPAPDRIASSPQSFCFLHVRKEEEDGEHIKILPGFLLHLVSNLQKNTLRWIIVKVRFHKPTRIFHEILLFYLLHSSFAWQVLLMEFDESSKLDWRGKYVPSSSSRHKDFNVYLACTHSPPIRHVQDAHFLEYPKHRS